MGGEEVGVLCGVCVLKMVQATRMERDMRRGEKT